MIYFTNYAEKKFDILNKHQVFFTKEQVKETINKPDQIKKKNQYLIASRENIRVIYEEKNSTKRVLTFYPVKL